MSNSEEWKIKRNDYNNDDDNNKMDNLLTVLITDTTWIQRYLTACTRPRLPS